MSGSPVTFAATKRTPALLGGAPALSEPVYVTLARRPDARALERLIGGVLRSQWFTNDGALVRRLEAELQRWLGVGFCAAFCNGTVALQVALRSLDLRGEVITTPFTFPATVHAIQWNGLTPVFCDVDPETYNLDVRQAAALVSERTSAFLPVHVFGNPCDVEGIEGLAQHHGCRVVYDAAHAFGVSVLGRPIGCWGDLSVLSFHATKLFHTAEGGAIVGRDRHRLGELALLRNFGIVNEEEVRGVGTNGKLSELHAAVGLTLLGGTHDEIEARRRLFVRYRERLAEVPGVVFQRLAPDTVPNYAYLTIEVDEEGFGLDRDALHAALRCENIVARKYFVPLCSENACYRTLPSAVPERLPNAVRLASRILCLPLYGEQRLEDVDRIVDCMLLLRSFAPSIRKVRAGRP